MQEELITQKIQKWIQDEDLQNPLTDQRITDLLRKEGFDIDRRTVAKYRDQLRISPARYRKG